MVKVAALAPIADNLWSATTPLRFWGVETGSRMTIARLDDGGLFVHSPLPLDDGLQLEVDAMGPVEFVVAPSLFHHMAVTAWKQAYPSAVYACCPGLERKRADIAWDRVLADRPEPEWASDLDQVFFAARTMENEVVFFHRATRTMIRDRKNARKQVDRMLAWRPERILLAHGPCIARDGEAVLREAYAWL